MPLTHPFEPIWSPQSKALILGTFPSVTSREQGFYYGHPRNRFWPLIAALFGESVPQNIAEKMELLLRCDIALWDVLSSCEITGSDDASIKQSLPNDITTLIQQSAITKVFCNGKKAYALYKKHCDIGIHTVCLPSTSPANAAWDFERLIEAWSVIV